MHDDLTSVLRQHGVQPSAQRLAVALYVLRTDAHPSADEVWARVRAGFPLLSRATVYNTLNLFVRRGLLRELVLKPGKVVFDANVERHHHFIDERTGRIYDVPWGAVRVRNPDSLPEFEVHDYQVVMRGRVRTAARPGGNAVDRSQRKRKIRS